LSKSPIMCHLMPDQLPAFDTARTLRQRWLLVDMASELNRGEEGGSGGTSSRTRLWQSVRPLPSNISERTQSMRGVDVMHRPSSNGSPGECVRSGSGTATMRCRSIIRSICAHTFDVEREKSFLRAILKSFGNYGKCQSFQT